MLRLGPLWEVGVLIALEASSRVPARFARLPGLFSLPYEILQPDPDSKALHLGIVAAIVSLVDSRSVDVAKQAR